MIALCLAVALPNDRDRVARLLFACTHISLILVPLSYFMNRQYKDYESTECRLLSYLFFSVPTIAIWLLLPVM
jgi:hypothetical protein